MIAHLTRYVYILPEALSQAGCKSFNDCHWRNLQEGVEESGVSLAFTVRAMDAGPVVAQERVAMSKYQDADEALCDLFDVGAR